MTDDLLARLRDAVGDAHVLTDPADVAAYVTDWRGAYRGRPLAVVRPASTAEVRRRPALATPRASRSCPQGGNTGLCGGAVPDASGTQVVLSLGRMRAVRASTPSTATITVEAGWCWPTCRRPPRPRAGCSRCRSASEGSCTIGGNLSTNAGGTAVLRYGMTRDLVLGLEVVLPDGRVWDGLRGLRKDNTGYDLKQLFIGAEGTLGIVTAAVLKLFPADAAPGDRVGRAARRRGRASSCSALLRERAGDRLTGFELMSRRRSTWCCEHLPGAARPARRPAPLVRRWSSSAGAGAGAARRRRSRRRSAEAVERGLRADAAIAGSPAQRAGLWALRENISRGAEAARARHQARHLAADLRASPAFVERPDRRARGAPARDPARRPTATSATATCTTT